ncbi:MAG: TIGR02391 family protein [Pseudomonadota bacterium]
MHIKLEEFERICRRAHVVNESTSTAINQHPFAARNLHQALPKKTKKLFDDGHYSEATFESLKFLDKLVQRLGGSRENGVKLMMKVFGGETPPIKLNTLASQSDIDEQEGFKFIFAGIMSALRNPKGHEYEIEDDPDTCLDHLTIISALFRKLESAGHKI